MKTEKIIEELEYLRWKLKGHKCRIDSRSGGGGGVCHVCMADLTALELIKDLKKEGKDET